jgi:flagellar biogenesis protein FliO
MFYPKRFLDALTGMSAEPNISSESFNANAPDLSSGDYGFALLKLLLSLVFVAILLWFTLWFLRRLIRYRFEKSGGVQTIKVLEKKMISPKTMLYFVEVNGEKILLAESQLEVRQCTLSSPSTNKDE